MTRTRCPSQTVYLVGKDKTWTCRQASLWIRLALPRLSLQHLRLPPCISPVGRLLESRQTADGPPDATDLLRKPDSTAAQLPRSNWHMSAQAVPRVNARTSPHQQSKVQAIWRRVLAAPASRQSRTLCDNCTWGPPGDRASLDGHSHLLAHDRSDSERHLYAHKACRKVFLGPRAGLARSQNVPIC